MLKRKKEYRFKSGIYKITCNENGFVYIGQSINLYRRVGEQINSLGKGEGRSPYRQADCDRYGPEAFDFDVLEYTDSSNNDILEKEYIEEARSSGKCYNVFDGGKTGYTATKEFGDKISKANKGKFVSDETKKLMSEHTKEQWKDKSFRDARVKSAKRQWLDDTYRKKMHDATAGKSELHAKKMTKEKVLSAREAYENGATITNLAAEYNVAYGTMQQIINKRTWKYI